MDTTTPVLGYLDATDGDVEGTASIPFWVGSTVVSLVLTPLRIILDDVIPMAHVKRRVRKQRH